MVIDIEYERKKTNDIPQVCTINQVMPASYLLLLNRYWLKFDHYNC